MNYPPNTPILPYKCEDESCLCHTTLTDLPYTSDQFAVPIPTALGWTVEIRNDIGTVTDIFHGRDDLNDLLESVHRAYPDAEFDPEGA